MLLTYRWFTWHITLLQYRESISEGDYEYVLAFVEKIF